MRGSLLNSKKRDKLIQPGGLVSCVSFGANSPGIFLALCQACRELGLDIISVDSQVRKGCFVKWILSRYHEEESLSLETMEAKFNEVAEELDFSSFCLDIPSQLEAASYRKEPNVGVFIQTENRVGILADLLEILTEYSVDINDIDVQLDEQDQVLTLLFKVLMPLSAVNFYDSLAALRQDIKSLGKKLDLDPFQCMVHSTETFAFLQEIDFENQT